jgi:imidazolonepropionase-like amidohydrolase
MRRVILLATSLLPATVACAPRVVAFTHVDLVDGRDSSVRRDQTVIVSGNRISVVAPSRTTRVPRNARVIDGRGKYLIPGLWDMHVHTAITGGRDLLPLYVANGVTGVRDMAGDWDTIAGWRGEISRGRLVGPRLVASGPYLEGGDISIPHLLARNPGEGRAAVDSLRSLGVDFVKIHGRISAPTYYAIARRSRELGIPFTGHVPRAVGAANASDSGHASIEHLLTIPVTCSAADSVKLAPRFPVQAALGRCDSRDLADLYARFVRNGTRITPTFVAQYEVAEWPRRELPGDSLARYLPREVRDFVRELFPMPDSVPEGADSVGRAMFALRLVQVAEMHRAGVRVLTGTDAPLRNSPPGFGLHEEMRLLALGGMSNLQVLAAATLEPARFLGMADSSGTIEPGKLADLVLLDANPLVDIGNVRRIRLFEGTSRRRLLSVYDN